MRHLKVVMLLVLVGCLSLLHPANVQAAEAVAIANLADAPLFTPEPTFSAGSCNTSCLGAYTTSPGSGAPSHWGKGATCAAAQLDLEDQLLAAADNKCASLGRGDACSLTVVVTAACYWSPSAGKYVVDGYANHKCLTTICI